MLAWRWFPHAALFSLALVLRVCWVLWVERTGFPFTDALFYHGHGESISRGDGFEALGVEGPSARWPPAYSVVLGGLYWLFGVDPLVGELFNALTGAVTVVLLMLLVERTLDRRTAIVAGTILTVMPGPILWTDVLVTETLFTAVFVGFFLVLAFARPTWGWMAAIGAVMGLGALVRGEALTWGLLPIVLFWRDFSRVDLLKRISVVAAAAVVVMSPWTIRNAIVMDAFVPVATNASQTLWSGHNDAATGGQVYPPPEYFDRFGPEAPEWELESVAALRNDAFEFMIENPVRELELIPLKIIHLNRGDSYALDWVNNDPDVPPISAINVERIGVIADAAYFALLTLTLLGVVTLGRPFWRQPIGRLVATSFLTALFLYGFLYYGNYRYRLPYEPFMIVVASSVLVGVWSRRPGADPAAGS